MNIETLISNSGWNIAEQQFVLSVLGEFGPQFQLNLQNRLALADFRYERIIWLSVIDKYLEVVPKARIGQLSPIVEWITLSHDEPLTDFGNAVVPIVIDWLNGDIASLPVPGEEGKKQLVAFLIEHFDRVPLEVLVEWCKGRVIELFSGQPLVDIFVKYRLAAWDGYMDEWGARLRGSLEQNSELLGLNAIEVKGKESRQDIKSWLLDFNTTVQKPIEARDAYDIVSYVQNSNNTKGLSPQENELLRQVLKLYMFFALPYVDFETQYVEFSTPNVEPDNSTRMAPVTSAPLMAEPEAPNIQGVLVKTPLNAEKQMGLDVTKLPEVFPQNASIVPSVEPVTVRQNAVPLKNAITQEEPAIRPKPVAPASIKPVPPKDLPHLASPVSLKRPAAKGSASLPLDMERIKKEAEAKRAVVQTDIDDKLDSLRQKENKQ